MLRASNRSERAATSASIGSLSSRSYSALRGWNQARALLSASSARNWIASGRNPAKAGARVAMTKSSGKRGSESTPPRSPPTYRPLAVDLPGQLELADRAPVAVDEPPLHAGRPVRPVRQEIRD